MDFSFRYFQNFLFVFRKHIIFMTTINITNTKRLIVILLITMLTVLSLTGCSKSSVAPAPFPEVAVKSLPEAIPRPYRVGQEWYQPIANAREFKQRGVASWYGKDFHGKKTSSGEIYNMYDMTAAHKILPLGTYVRVKNLKNNRVIDVRINDRGPFVPGRIIDLSYTAAKKLEIIGPGTATVEIVALGTPNSSKKDSKDIAYIPIDYFSGVFSVQVGAFQDQNNADRLRKEIALIHKDTYISPFSSGDKTLYRVRVGRYSSVDQVMNTEKVLIENGYTDAFSVAE
jgi:rare lipoprotein A